MSKGCSWTAALVGFFLGITLARYIVSTRIAVIQTEFAIETNNNSKDDGRPLVTKPDDTLGNLNDAKADENTSPEEPEEHVFSVPEKAATGPPTYNCQKRFEKAGTPPSFMIVGVHKGGTTALYSYLAKHGQIMPAICKEIHFFDMEKRVSAGEDFYLQHFPNLSQWNGQVITGEGSPNYIRVPEVAGRIKSMFPNTKFLLLLREPTMRFRSHWLEKRNAQIDISKTAFGKMPCELAWRFSMREIRDCLEGSHVSACFQLYQDNPIMQGLYAAQLETWLKYFPPEQTMIIQSEAMFKDVPGTLQKVAQFLQLRHFTKEELASLKHANVGTDYHDDPILSDCAKSVGTMQEFYAPYNKRLMTLLEERFPSVAAHWIRDEWNV